LGRDFGFILAGVHDYLDDPNRRIASSLIRAAVRPVFIITCCVQHHVAVRVQPQRRLSKATEPATSYARFTSSSSHIATTTTNTAAAAAAIAIATDPASLGATTTHCGPADHPAVSQW